jgi:hypothetical protein
MATIPAAASPKALTGWPGKREGVNHDRRNQRQGTCRNTGARDGPGYQLEAASSSRSERKVARHRKQKADRDGRDDPGPTFDPSRCALASL